MEIEGLIRRGENLKNLSKETRFGSAEYQKWMNEVQSYSKSFVKDIVLKQAIDKCYFYKNSSLSNSYEEVMGVLTIIRDKNEKERGNRVKEMKFFISHSTKDVKLTQEFIGFLREGLDIKKSEIFCSSLNNAIPIGEKFIPVMQEKIGKCDEVILLLTENYLNSKFCLAELGAAWALNQNIIPIIVPSVGYSDLDDTPLKGMQMMNLYKSDDLHKFFGHLVKQGLVNVDMVSDFSKAMSRFVREENRR